MGVFQHLNDLVGDIKSNRGDFIIDIRDEAISSSLNYAIKNDFLSGCAVSLELPTLLLYDELGLQKFENVCRNKAYYPTRTEMEILERSADDIVSDLSDGTVLIEFGSGYRPCIDTFSSAFQKFTLCSVI
jgi:uncharacterized SAM-dependent methyltransferase